jgi:hypothetical protein
LFEDALTGARVFVMNAAEIVLDFLIGDGRAGEELAEGVDVDG